MVNGVFHCLWLLLVLVFPTSPKIMRCGGGCEYTRNDFPPDFVFGAGTSAYQYEGGVAEDGRTPSVWDTFTHQGRMIDNSTGDITSDGYHKYKEDVNLMGDIGLEAYRFSISWSRLIPNGRGEMNPKGLKYYNDVINELIKHGIQPHIIVNHLDIPQVLEDEYKGWLSPKIVDDFRAYADICFREFGDRIKHWTTLDEPNIMAIAAYDNGALAPGRCSPPFGVGSCTDGDSTTEPYIVLHNQILAHAAVVQLYKTKYQAIQKGIIGFNLYSFWFDPLTDSDVEATKRALEFMIGWMLDPLVYGDYPKIMKEVVGSRLPSFTEQQSQLVKGSYDFISLNYYATVFIKDMGPLPEIRDYNADMGVLMTGFRNETPIGKFEPQPAPVHPIGLERIIRYITNNYNKPPIYIQESGYATPPESGLNDTVRKNAIIVYIGALLPAMRSGANVKGYFVWSFLDVFEFISGYQQRYGLYYVDFDDDKRGRKAKDSALWYKKFLTKKSDIKMKGVGQQEELHNAK